MNPRGCRRFYREAASLLVTLSLLGASAADEPPAYELNDSHFHLTNYIQEGPSIRDFLALMGSRVGRVALFGIPLQQTWSYANSGKFAPNYYLQSDAPLYYYSFTDAEIAMAYRSLPPQQQARFDPMICGFNPSDMYAADHIRRVLETFPGVFSGIGEFTIHKEFVSSKIAGEVASLTDPALDRLLEFAGEVGLLALIHNDMDVPFAAPGTTPVYLAQMENLLRRHPGTTVIWAHLGLGRVIHPVQGHAAIIEELLSDPALAHVYFDLSWDEVAKYVVSSPATVQRTAEVIERHPDRFLFGTDAVAPPDAQTYLKVFEQYRPLWQRLSPATLASVTRTSYERLFDEARRRVRSWEREHVP